MVKLTGLLVLLAAVAANGNFICDLLKNEEMEKKAVDLVCTKLTQEHAEMCEKAITFIWGALAKKECPDGNSQDVEAIPPMVCKVVQNEEIEKKAVSAICSKQHEVPAEECEMLLTKAWDAFSKKECANMVTAEEKPCCQGPCTQDAPPGYGPIEKYYSICSESSDPLWGPNHCQFGKSQCSEACLDPRGEPFWRGSDKNLTKADNDSPCKAFGFTAYAYTGHFSQRTAGTLTQDFYYLPKLSAAVPPMICKLVENQMLEKKVVDEICSKEHKMPTTECEAALTKLWDVITQKECPKVELTAIPPMVCKLVKLPELEKKAVDAICSKQHEVPAAECEEVLTKAWDALVKKECPDSDAIVV